MYSDILKQLQTTNDRNEMLICIRNILLDIDQPNASSQELVNKLMPIKFSQAIDIDQVNQNPKKFFQDLEMEIENLPVASLEIAIEPTQDLIDTVVHWFDINVEQKVLLEFSVDPSLILGARVDFRGKYYDAAK